MRILVFDSTSQMNAHIIYGSLLAVCHVMIGMVIVLVSVLYANGFENEHTHWNSAHQNKHSITAMLGFQFLLCLGIMAHNRTDGWSSSLQNIARLVLHVVINLIACALYWISLVDAVEMTGGRDNTCGRSGHCRTGWIAMYIASSAFMLGPLAAIFDHFFSVLHSILGMLTFAWASSSVISGIQLDIVHRARYVAITKRQHEELGRLGIVLVYIYTSIVLIYPTIKAFYFIMRIKDIIKRWKGTLKKRKSPPQSDHLVL